VDVIVVIFIVVLLVVFCACWLQKRERER